MSIIETVDEDEATGFVAEVYAREVKDLGYVASHTKMMTMNPEAHAAFEQLIRAIVAQLGVRRYELVTLAAAEAVHSQACRLAHGRKTLKVMDEDQLVRVARDYHDAGLTEAEVAMMEFAERVVTDSADMTDADTLRLREVGFTDREIVDITLAASVRGYFSRALQALAVEPDSPPDLSPRLRGALLAPL